MKKPIFLQCNLRVKRIDFPSASGFSTLDVWYDCDVNDFSSAQAGYCSRDSTDVGKHGDLVFGVFGVAISNRTRRGGTGTPISPQLAISLTIWVSQKREEDGGRQSNRLGWGAPTGMPTGVRGGSCGEQRSSL